MIIYFVCYYVRTGGPENIHLTCSEINKKYNNQGIKSVVIYLENPSLNNLYPEIPNIETQYYTSVVDDEKNIVIFPEICDVDWAKLFFRLNKCKIGIWWLSYVNACMKGTLKNMYRHDVIHFFHSYYEYAMIKPFIKDNYLFLTDYLGEEYLQLNPDDFTKNKEMLVCFNGHKDKTTKTYCDLHNIPYIQILNMSREDVNKTLERCMVYVDNGFHPGKDHLPREAALHGCVVVTNKSGSAAYWEDVPIVEKISFEDEIGAIVNKIFQNYELFYKNQSYYRNQIRNEKKVALEHIDKMIEFMSHYS